VTGEKMTEETADAATFGKRGFKLAKLFKTGPETRKRNNERAKERIDSGRGPKF
jgi:hypothetical protein